MLKGKIYSLKDKLAAQAEAEEAARIEKEEKNKTKVKKVNNKEKK